MAAFVVRIVQGKLERVNKCQKLVLYRAKVLGTQLSRAVTLEKEAQDMATESTAGFEQIHRHSCHDALAVIGVRRIKG